MKRTTRDIYSITLDKDNFGKQFSEYLNKKKKNGKLELAISLNGKMVEDASRTIEQIEELAKIHGFNPYSTRIIMERTTIFSPEQLKQLVEFNKKLKDKFSSEIGVLSMSALFSLGEVEKACNKVYNFYNNTAREKLSPAECLLASYILATSKAYAKEEITDGLGKSRSIYGILNSDKIVCLGYISLINNLTYHIPFENLFIIRNTNAVQSGNEFIGHSSAIVYINDPKYNLNGFYFLDPTKDVIGEDGMIKLNHFLVPLKDIKHSKHQYLNRRAHTTRKPLIKNETKVKFGAPKIDGLYYLQHTDLISYGQEGLELYNRKRTKDLIKELLGKRVPEIYDDVVIIKILMEENSAPISYVNMQKLIYNTLLKVNKNVSADMCWNKSKKIMRYSTMRSNAHYNLCDELGNPFAIQAYEEKRFKRTQSLREIYKDS